MEAHKPAWAEKNRVRARRTPSGPGGAPIVRLAASGYVLAAVIIPLAEFIIPRSAVIIPRVNMKLTRVNMKLTRSAMKLTRLPITLTTAPGGSGRIARLAIEPGPAVIGRRTAAASIAARRVYGQPALKAAR